MVDAFKKGDRVIPKGYLPATVCTGRLTRGGELAVRFDWGPIRYFRPERLRRAEDEA